MGVDFRLLREAKERLAKQDTRVGKCILCGNYYDLATKARVMDIAPAGTVSHGYCGDCGYVEKAIVDAELARLRR